MDLDNAPVPKNNIISWWWDLFKLLVVPIAAAIIAVWTLAIHNEEQIKWLDAKLNEIQSSLSDHTTQQAVLESELTSLKLQVQECQKNGNVRHR